MLPFQGLVGEFFAKLEELDERIARAVAAVRCRHCGGPLHRGDYRRKPRGGLIAVEGEAFALRHSLCCGRRGCRKRALPPSVRFLGRRVYLEAVVLLASMLSQVMATVREAVIRSGVPARTLRRWGTWWREIFPQLPTWVELQAWFRPPPPDKTYLPHSLFERLEFELRNATPAAEPTSADVAFLSARCLAPLTTHSVIDGSRFLRAAVAPGASS